MSLNFSMENPNPLTFLGNVQCKIVKQLKNNDFFSIFYNHSTITVKLFEIFKMLSGMCLECTMKCFSLILGMVNPNPLLCLCNIKWKLTNQLKIVIYIVISIIVLSLSTCLKFYKCLQQSVWHIE